jgi:hypothetical protein
VKVIECFELSEGNEDCSRYSHVAYLMDENNAKIWKGDNYFRSIEKATIVIFDNLGQMIENEKEKVRERALAKLTAIERKALGY